MAVPVLQYVSFPPVPDINYPLWLYIYLYIDRQSSRELSIPPASISLLGATLPLLQKSSEKLICSHMFQAKAPSAFRQWCGSPSLYSGIALAKVYVSTIRNKRTKKTSIKIDNLNFQAEITSLHASHKLSKCRDVNPDLFHWFFLFIVCKLGFLGNRLNWR